MAEKLGFDNLPLYQSIVLGGVELAPIQLAHAYAILANEGLEVPFYAVTAVVDENGKVIQGHELKASQVLSPELAYTMDFMLEEVINHGTGEDARKMGFKPAAGKPAPLTIQLMHGSQASRRTCSPLSGLASTKKTPSA